MSTFNLVISMIGGPQLLRAIFTTLRVVLGVLLVVSSFAKLRQPFDFLNAVYEYQLLTPQGGAIVAAVLPLVELVVGCCLIIGLLTRGALLMATTMFAAFTVAICTALARNLSISCGCFGTEEALDYKTLGRTMSIAITASILLILALKHSDDGVRTLKDRVRI